MLTLFLLAQASASAPVEKAAKPVSVVQIESSCDAYVISVISPIVDTPGANAQAQAASRAVATAQVPTQTSDSSKSTEPKDQVASQNRCENTLKLETPKADSGASKLAA